MKMNEQTNDWLNDLPVADPAWLELLVDGELTSQQRRAVIQHVESSGNWKQLATMFLDEQVLAETVRLPDSIAPRGIQKSVPRSSSAFRWLPTIAAGLLAGILLGRSLFPTTVERVVEVPSAAQPAAEKSTPSTAVANSDRPTLPALFQAKNTATEAVYYTDFSVPQFLLDALVVAGHRVELDQEFLGYTESPDSVAAVPINVLRVHKYDGLMAALDLPVFSTEPTQE